MHSIKFCCGCAFMYSLDLYLCPAAVLFFCRLGIAFQEEMCDIDIEVKVVKFGDVIVEVENIKDQLANLRYMANIS